jgi:hypothetical protein
MLTFKESRQLKGVLKKLVFQILHLCLTFFSKKMIDIHFYLLGYENCEGLAIIQDKANGKCLNISFRIRIITGLRGYGTKCPLIMAFFSLFLLFLLFFCFPYFSHRKGLL